MYDEEQKEYDMFDFDGHDVAFYCLVYVAILVVMLALFVIREKCKADQDAQLHPFHQMFEKRQIDKKE